MSEEDRFEITEKGLNALNDGRFKITFTHHAENQHGWREQWTIEATGNDLEGMASQVHNANVTLIG